MGMVKALAVLLLLVACGCSADPRASEQRSSAFPGAGVDCPTEEPHPITADLATDTLVAGGFDVVFDPEACGFGEIAGMLSNSSSLPGVLDDDGVVVCFLLVGPRDGTTTPEVSGDTGGAHSELSLANLTCDLYADGVPADDEFARFEQAFEELRKQIE